MSQNLPSSLYLKVITPKKLLVDVQVDEVSLPSLEGSLGILPGHRRLLAALGNGVLSYRMAMREEKFPVKGGFAEIEPEKVLVFTELSQDETTRLSRS